MALEGYCTNTSTARNRVLSSREIISRSISTLITGSIARPSVVAVLLRSRPRQLGRWTCQTLDVDSIVRPRELTAMTGMHGLKSALRLPNDCAILRSHRPNI